LQCERNREVQDGIDIMEGGVNGDLQKGVSEEPEATVYAVIRIQWPCLNTKNQ